MLATGAACFSLMVDDIDSFTEVGFAFRAGYGAPWKDLWVAAGKDFLAFAED